MLHVIAPTRIKSAKSIGIILSEAPIRTALKAYAWRVLATGLLRLGASRRCWSSLAVLRLRAADGAHHRRDDALPRQSRGFRDASSPPSSRQDEIGVAERELASMQRDLYGSLQQKTRLAALGAAVARIQHDLRNILANAKLASDRLSTIEDPVVKRLTPRLVASLDRAVALATQTLRYGRADERPP